jgi:hypothetical protein
MTIVVPADGGTSDSWGEWITLRKPLPTELVIDLGALRNAGPSILLRLRALIDLQCFEGGTVEIIPPSDSTVRAYVAMMRLGADLPATCACDLEPIEVIDPNKILIPIRRLNTREESDRLDEELSELLEAQFTGKIGRLARAFTQTASEMCDNATSHGWSEVGGAYVSAQRYTKQRCVLAIGDLGVGIPEHIRKARPHLTNDDDAIRVATRNGVTATGSPHRGVGYQWAIDSMKETKVPSGELRVWSGRGRFRVEVEDGMQQRRRAWPIEEATAGTWVRLWLSAQ